MKKLVVTLLAAGSLILAQQRDPSNGRVDFVKQEGQRIVAEASATLASNLLQAATQGGFSNALAVCSVHAIPITEEISASHRVVLRRVALRTRNKQNVPDEIERRFLNQFIEAAAEGQPPAFEVHAGPDEVRFFAPIVLNNVLCLNCHGEPGTQVQPETLGTIRKLYPKDEATGYKLGDIRGMWSISFREFPKPAEPTQD